MNTGYLSKNRRGTNHHQKYFSDNRISTINSNDLRIQFEKKLTIKLPDPKSLVDYENPDHK